LTFSFNEPNSIIAAIKGAGLLSLRYGGIDHRFVRIDLNDFAFEHGEALFESYTASVLRPPKSFTDQAPAHKRVHAARRPHQADGRGSREGWMGV
jgi:hypothetical protein